MLITRGTVITLEQDNRVIPNGAILIRDDLISQVGTSAELEPMYPREERLDASGKLMMPGNICAHAHCYGAFARGMPVLGEPPRSFAEIMDRLWRRLERALTYEDIRSSALVSVLEAIRHGTTTVMDHHASQTAVAYSLDAVAEAVQLAGLRACLCYEVSDRDGPAAARAGIDENVRFNQSSAVTPMNP